MRQRLLTLVILMMTVTICLCACSKANSAPMSSVSDMTQQFFKDANLPDEIYDQFAAAVQGDVSAQEWLDEYDNKNNSAYFSVLNDVFPYRNGSKGYSENECCYHIGSLYYAGDKNVPITQNKEKAFHWYCLSAEKGGFEGAINAGDMAQSGDGISLNNRVAFAFYQKALELKKCGDAYERLALCYEKGLGSAVDEQQALQYYFMSTLYGNVTGLYQLSKSDGLSKSQSILFSKAASSMDYSANYFDMAYEGIGGYTPSESKLETVEKLNQAWENGTDPVAGQLKTTISENQYFPKAFVEALVRTSYTYSYHAFAEKYGIEANLTEADVNQIQFAPSGYDGHAAESYYQLDFDGDGEDEIGIPFHSGAGGAFMEDGFAIYKKNAKGLYDEYAHGPDCTLRDAMRLIKYNGKVYFITNPFSDTMDTPNDITAYTIDNEGQGHQISINCTENKPKEIMTQAHGQYHSDQSKDFIHSIMSQAFEAIDATKKHVMYNPNESTPVHTADKAQVDFAISTPEDAYFAADIDNDGVQEFVRKGHMITQMKYYDDYNLFQVYKNEAELSENAKPILNVFPYDDFYGLHSGGNIYDMLPIGSNIVQFWTYEKDNITYCIALTRNKLVYALHVYTIQNDIPIAVCNSLLFDEVQNIEVNFS